MNRSRSRTSRILLIILMLTVLVGVLTFANKYFRRDALAADPAKPSAATYSPPPRAVEGDFDTAIVTRTPTSGPSTAKPRAATTSPTTRSTSVKSYATTLPTILLSSKPLADAK